MDQLTLSTKANLGNLTAKLFRVATPEQLVGSVTLVESTYREGYYTGSVDFSAGWYDVVLLDSSGRKRGDGTVYLYQNNIVCVVGRDPTVQALLEQTAKTGSYQANVQFFETESRLELGTSYKKGIQLIAAACVGVAITTSENEETFYRLGSTTEVAFVSSITTTGDRQTITIE